MAGTGVDTREIFGDKTTLPQSPCSARKENSRVPSSCNRGKHRLRGAGCVCEKGTPEPNLGGQGAASQQVHLQE